MTADQGAEDILVLEKALRTIKTAIAWEGQETWTCEGGTLLASYGPGTAVQHVSVGMTQHDAALITILHATRYAVSAALDVAVGDLRKRRRTNHGSVADQASLAIATAIVEQVAR